MDEVTDQASSSKEKAEDINKVESETWLDATLTLRNDPEFSDPKFDLKEMPELRMSSAEDDSDDNATDDYKKTEKEDEGKKKRIGTKVAKTGIRRNVRASKSSKIPSLRSRTPDSGQTAGVAKMKASVSPKLAPSPEKPGIVSDSVDKVSVYEMLIKMLERNEDKKGLSVPMLKKLFREKHPEKDWDRLRPYLKRAIEKGEAEGTIVRPKSCADSKGLQGSFLLKSRDEMSFGADEPSPRSGKKAEQDFGSRRKTFIVNLSQLGKRPECSSKDLRISAVEVASMDLSEKLYETNEEEFLAIKQEQSFQELLQAEGTSTDKLWENLHEELKVGLFSEENKTAVFHPENCVLDSFQKRCIPVEDKLGAQPFDSRLPSIGKRGGKGIRNENLDNRRTFLIRPCLDDMSGGLGHDSVEEEEAARSAISFRREIDPKVDFLGDADELIYDQLVEIFAVNHERKKISIQLLRKLLEERHLDFEWTKSRLSIKRALEKAEKKGLIVRPGNNGAKGLQGSLVFTDQFIEDMKTSQRNMAPLL